MRCSTKRKRVPPRAKIAARRERIARLIAKKCVRRGLWTSKEASRFTKAAAK